jgi:hypothetical protein
MGSFCNNSAQFVVYNKAIFYAKMALKMQIIIIKTKKFKVSPKKTNSQSRQKKKKSSKKAVNRCRMWLTAN